VNGTREFDGRQYPDAESSDPMTLRYMQGSPPPPDKRIRFDDDSFWKFPQLRWSLSNMRSLVTTANVARVGGAPSNLDGAPSGSVSPGRMPGSSAAGLDELAFTDLLGVRRTWAQSLPEVYCDGILVMHRGRRIYERYFGALAPERPHACFSITKSYAATLAAMLIHEGVLDAHRLVPHYLPEMADTAYADATLRQVLDMQIGVDYSENYADPAAGVWDYSRAGGWRPRPPGYTGPDHFYDYLTRLRKQGEHGREFTYKTVNTEVLCWVMKRATGIGLADLLSQRLWSRLGCEQDAYLFTDPIGVECGGGGLAASLRDLARFGELMRREGDWHGRQLIPAAVIDDIRRGADQAKFTPAGYTLLPGYSYRNMWWVTHNDLGAYEARGIHGQRLYIAPAAELVIARFASHPIASSAANDPITLPAFLALARELQAVTPR
jgi:CubicO group peptidase (beta-lactamase class C family)